ncbi:MAG: DUF1819 family protein [Deltaproteobacteria bacterium]|nr:DUF1819 family protein [Deltaproteobacteria bacterium]
MDKRNQKYTANITMGAALKEEAKTVLQHVHFGNSNKRIKQLVIEENLLDKATIASRKNAWGLIEGRYLKNSNCPTNLIAQIVASQKGESIVDWMLFYHCCLADTLIYDVTVGLTYHRFISGATRIDKPDVISFLEERKKEHPEIEKFSQLTKDKIARNYLTLLRDFGLLEGKVIKYFKTVFVPIEFFVYVVYFLIEQGMATKAILSSDDFNLFFLSEEDVLRLMNEASRTPYLDFTSAGDIYNLQLTRESLTDYVNELTGQI